MTDDLVKTWDDLKDNMPESHADAAEAMYDLGDKMADRIEALEAENRKTRRETPRDHTLSEVLSAATVSELVAEIRRRGNGKCSAKVNHGGPER